MRGHGRYHPVYLRLEEAGPATITELADAVDMRRGAVERFVERALARGDVRRLDERRGRAIVLGVVPPWEYES